LGLVGWNGSPKMPFCNKWKGVHGGCGCK
jgi:hypothetical protein